MDLDLEFEVAQAAFAVHLLERALHDTGRWQFAWADQTVDVERIRSADGVTLHGDFEPLVCFLVAGVAELQRPPFDMPVADSEIVFGPYTEYTGLRFAFFLLSEYAGIVVLSALTAVLFETGKWALGAYLGSTTSDDAYGGASSLILLLLWVYYSSLIVLLGAGATRWLATRMDWKLSRRGRAA